MLSVRYPMKAAASSTPKNAGNRSDLYRRSAAGSIERFQGINRFYFYRSYFCTTNLSVFYFILNGK